MEALLRTDCLLAIKMLIFLLYDIRHYLSIYLEMYNFTPSQCLGVLQKAQLTYWNHAPKSRAGRTFFPFTATATESKATCYADYT